MNTLLFQNAVIATSERVFTGDLLVQNGKISQLGQNLSHPDAKVVPCNGKYLLPGGVDAHTHFDLDVGFTRASDKFYTGTRAAAFGGTTTVIDHMAFGPAGCPLTHQPGVYHQLAKDAVVDYGLHGVIQHVDQQVLSDMETLMKTQGISSFKAYMTYDFGLDDVQLLCVLQRAQELGIVLCVHCENDGIINTLRRECIAAGKTQPRFHPLSRPDQAEAEAVFRVLALAKTAKNPHLCIVHLTSAYALEAARLAQRFGQQNLHLETCPQYLFLDDSLYEDDSEGLKAIMSPPLRRKEDQRALWQAVASEEIETIATDHCPFFFATQKQRGKDNFTLCPNGAPGVELRFPLLFSHTIRQQKPDFPLLVRQCCTNPARLFGAGQKGDLRTGLDADLVLFDPGKTWTIHKDLLHENTDYTLYEGHSLQGAVELTVSRGEVIMEKGCFLGQKGRGQYIRRSGK